MREIPEDILTASAAAVEVMPHRPPFKADVLKAIANAILAERRRCADIARGLNGWGPVGGNKVAEHIAKVIEEGI